MRPGRSPGKPSSFCHCDASRRHRQSPHRASTAVEQPGAPGESLTVGDDLHRTGIAVEPSNALAQSPGHRPSIDLGDDHDPPSRNVQGLAEPQHGGHLRTPTAHRRPIDPAQLIRHFSDHHHRDTVHHPPPPPPDPRYAPRSRPQHARDYHQGARSMPNDDGAGATQSVTDPRHRVVEQRGGRADNEPSGLGSRSDLPLNAGGRSVWKSAVLARRVGPKRTTTPHLADRPVGMCCVTPEELRYGRTRGERWSPRQGVRGPRWRFAALAARSGSLGVDTGGGEDGHGQH